MKTKVTKTTKVKNAITPAPVETLAVVAPREVESNRPLSEVMALVTSEGKAIAELSATEYAAAISEKLRSATMGLRLASMLGYQASTEGKFQKVLERLTESGEFAPQTIYGLAQTVTKTIPFLLSQDANIAEVKNLDGFRDLMPKVTTTDKTSGKLVVVKGSEAIVKRAIAGESPRKLVEEIKAASGSETTSSAATVPFRIRKIADGIKPNKAGKHDATCFINNAGRAAALGGLTLDEAKALLEKGYGAESDAILAREAKEAADATKKAAKAEAAKAKKATKVKPKAKKAAKGKA